MKYKNQIFILIFLAFQLGSSQNNHYYYHNNQKIYIDIDQEYVALNASSNLPFLNNYAANYVSKTDFTQSNVRTYTIPKDSIAQSRVALKNYYSEIRVTNTIKNSTQNYNNFINSLNQDANIIKVSPCFNYQGKILGLTNNFYVKLKSLSDETILYNYVQANNLEVIGSDPYSPEWYIISCTNANNKNALEYANQFHESELFESAEPEFTYHNLSASNDPFFSDQWGIKNTGQFDSTYAGIDINAEPAWTITKGNNIKVGVFDSGFEMNHPDLIQNVLGNGFDVMTETSPSQVRGDHGTACAGIVGAVQNNNVGISGVAPEAKLISISMDLETTTTGLQIKSGFDWAVQNDIDVLNCSWGGFAPSSFIETGIANALNNGRNGKGCVVVFASGNNGFNNTSITYPANSLPDILTVGAMTPCGERKIVSANVCHEDLSALWASAYGTQLDIVAPGLNVPTTDRQGNNGYNPDLQFESNPDYATHLNYHSSFRGTSAAAPHVAGLAALVLSVNPNLTSVQVNTIIEQTAQKMRPDLYNYENNPNRPNGTWHQEMGYGLVDAYAAVQLAQNMASLDLMVKDSPDDTGIEPNPTTQNMWTSQDIWVRNFDDNGLQHQNPEYKSNNQPNYINVRVKNKSLVPSIGNETLIVNWAKANTALAYPDNWDGSLTNNGNFPLGGVLTAVNIPVVQPNNEVIVKIPWVVPDPNNYLDNDNPWHFCLLATINSTEDPLSYPTTMNPNIMVRNNNNQAWKNITVVDLVAERPIGGVVGVGNFFEQTHNFTLHFSADDLETGKLIFEEAEVTIEMDEVLFQAWQAGGKESTNIQPTKEPNKVIITGDDAVLDNLIFPPRARGRLYLTFNFLTKEITGKSTYTYHVVQNDKSNNEVIGGETYVINKDPRSLFYADAGDNKYIDRNETVTLNAETIGEPALYNWYDSEGNLIFEGASFEVSVEMAKAYKLEVVALSDGYKDYTEIEINLNPNSIETTFPNPSSGLVTTTYKINQGDSAYLSVTGFYGSNISNNYILDISENQITFNIDNYPQGLYTIALIVNGEIEDTTTLMKQ